MSEEASVIIYSTSDCPYCTMAKGYLESKGIRFTNYDVSRDRAKADEMFQKSGGGSVPVLDINHRIIVGFDRQLIDDALKRKAPPKREDSIRNLSFDLLSD